MTDRTKVTPHDQVKLPATELAQDRALNVAAGLDAHRYRAIRAEIDLQVAMAASFHTAWKALSRAADEVPT